MDKTNTRNFYQILANTLVANITNMTVFFAIIFFAYLETKSVFVTGMISGIYLVATAITGFWFGGIVDNFKKKQVMIISSVISLVIYIITFLFYISVPIETFRSQDNAGLWFLIVLLVIGIIAGNLRNIALPVLVTILVPEDKRDKANGLVGTVSGIGFLITSVISGFLVGKAGMFLVLLLSAITTLLAIIHVLLIPVPEVKVLKASEQEGHEGNSEESLASKSKLDIRGTIRAIRSVPGLLTLILFTTFNNFLGGVFMSLMDAYGLSLVSVEVWGVLWGILSCAFIVGGVIIAKKGLGKNPLKSMFIANIIIWTISIFFTIQPWILLLMVGMFIYLSVVPFIEAAEHTIMQKVVPPERLGRVFGFAHSVEQAASPLTAFLIGPITELVFIPFMTDGAGAQTIGSWFGTGPARGIALVFTLIGVIGLAVTLLATRSLFYKQLSAEYRNHKSEESESTNA